MLKIVVALLLLIALAVGAYVAYMFATYSRIEDNAALEVENNVATEAEVGKEYTALTYNIGFGAYSFMDGEQGQLP